MSAVGVTDCGLREGWVCRFCVRRIEKRGDLSELRLAQSTALLPALSSAADFSQAPHCMPLPSHLMPHPSHPTHTPSPLQLEMLQEKDEELADLQFRLDEAEARLEEVSCCDAIGRSTAFEFLSTLPHQES